METNSGIPRGCELCVQGRKIQIHTTFRCNKKCGFCPIPVSKLGSDVIEIDGVSHNPNQLVFLLEQLVLNKKDMLGAALSGGEPTLVFDRVINAIKILKVGYGHGFHIHLYTNGKNLTDNMVRQLSEAGLDELRVNSLNPMVFEVLTGSSFDVVCEIPCLPSQKYIDVLLRLVDNFPRLGVKHLNLNEAEITRENSDFFRKLGIASSGTKVLESARAAHQIIEYCQTVGVNVFFCSYEIANRIRIARNRT